MVASDWVSEAESLDSFTSLQIDTLHALWNLYGPSSERGPTLASGRRSENGARAE